MTILKQNDKRLDMAPMSAALIPDDTELANCGVFQEVKFIGYPIHSHPTGFEKKLEYFV